MDNFVIPSASTCVVYVRHKSTRAKSHSDVEDEEISCLYVVRICAGSIVVAIPDRTMISSVPCRPVSTLEVP